MEQNKERVAELEANLAKWRESYYNLDPIVTDKEYDAAKTELSYLAPDNKEVRAVGARPEKGSTWEKVEHAIPMGSLSKVNSKDEFFDWAETTGASEFLITHKIDGSSMELSYKGGKLVRAVTRGDGTIGEDVTANVSQIPNVPKKIDEMGDVSVRGEVVMEKSVFEEKYSKEYANPRNTANGKVREKKNGGADCANLSFIAYTLYLDGSLPETEVGQFEVLDALGFETPYRSVGGTFDMSNVFEAIKNSREYINYEIDGLVIRVNDISVQDELGSKDMRPKGQIAWKFDAAMSTTKVNGVRWQVGPSGRITPVAEVEPVQIGGVTITSINLHNIKMFKNLKLFEGCEVLVARRGDVIPYIERNVSLGIDANKEDE